MAQNATTLALAVADELRQFMAEHGLTQARVADLAGVHPKTVSSWLAAESSACRRNMTARHLRLIQLALAAESPALRRLAAARNPRPDRLALAGSLSGSPDSLLALPASAPPEKKEN